MTEAERDREHFAYARGGGIPWSARRARTLKPTPRFHSSSPPLTLWWPEAI
jgi:hypothetical protein